ncbi:hypothetical protein, variant [Blastomyces gilchristii SLH14081]|uniref:Uncharacterized protein n=2 Tax=Blastomyces TaxID=229219 RepID=A0A179UUP3_BLAGS|nr:hypothetical protein, variant [Blastomyces gilchristii SLH14081]XP_031579500.1 uncharacterized protein BDBG_06568 [Blastomyces gilchristii SLH14081]EGE78729.1 hypothetical protein BDDG_01666 [Blastomyces dermatitidis ATCC 18188]KMW66804.1 hypothetical protein, variant [Blastomyces dermatitidis ATCC 18188]OAT10771.1 hypothetical protein BDBG_06568 [Blastomyces gilchristii SLH14081]OAT10772.1 hypothetical protein, variant [Blastomyces gilchristii SLH14081]
MEHNSENTPLLVDANAESPDANTQTNIPLMRNSTAEAFHMTLALTWLSLALSVLAFAFTFTVLLGIHAFWRDSHIDWTVRESCAWMMILGICTALISFFNLVCLYLRRGRAMPLVFNLVIDIIVVFYSFGCTITGLIENYSWCEWDCDDSNTRMIQIVAGIGLSFGLGLGITHLVLFLMRCTRTIRWLIEWRRNGSMPSFQIPTGQFTVEITFRLLRQDNANVLESTNRGTRSENITAEANRELI